MGLILGRTGTASRLKPGFGTLSRQAEAGELLTYDGDGHLLTLAPSGTGKTSGPVICNARTHPGQLIVLDIKGEVYAKTAAHRREMGQEVHVLDLRDNGEAGSLNPLDLAMRSGTDLVAVARSFAAELIERGEEREKFWNDQAESLLTGGFSWLLSDVERERRSVGELFNLLHKDDVVFSIACAIDKKEIRNRAAISAFNAFLQLPGENTRASVLGSTQVHIRLFDSELVRRVTDTTSFDLDALIAGEPMSLYIIVPPYRLAAYRPLLRMWLSGLFYVLTLRESLPEQRTLMLCDEIGNLGKIEAFLMVSSLMRGYGLTLWSFFQNPAQLQVYGAQANTLIDNAGVIQCFGARNQRMAKEFCDLIGGVTPETVMKLGAGEQLVLIEGGEPMRCRQVRYYDDPVFQRSVQSGAKR